MLYDIQVGLLGLQGLVDYVRKTCEGLVAASLKTEAVQIIHRLTHNRGPQATRIADDRRAAKRRKPGGVQKQRAQPDSVADEVMALLDELELQTDDIKGMGAMRRRWQ